MLNEDGNESEVVGYIMLALNKEKRKSFIQGLFVAEKYRHKEIAKGLIKEAEKYSRTIGCKDIIAEMNYHLLKFYNDLGFSIYKRKNDSTFWISKSLERNVELEKESDWQR